jgi:hypothetical protein
VVAVLFNYDFASNAELLRLKNAFILVALGASSFELYFYLNYRLYMGARTANSRKRREVFIREMIQDFGLCCAGVTAEKNIFGDLFTNSPKAVRAAVTERPFF